MEKPDSQTIWVYIFPLVLLLVAELLEKEMRVWLSLLLVFRLDVKETLCHFAKWRESAEKHGQTYRIFYLDIFSL
jgi:hypothetical protein